MFYRALVTSPGGVAGAVSATARGQPRKLCGLRLTGIVTSTLTHHLRLSYLGIIVPVTRSEGQEVPETPSTTFRGVRWEG